MIIYSRATCGPCHQLKKYLLHKGVAFIEKSVDDENNLREMLKITGVQIVPTAVKGEKYVIGLNYSAINAML